MNEVEGQKNYRSESFLRAHIQDCMKFYENSMDENDDDAGFFHYFDDSGNVIDTSHRHLVSSARFVFIYAMAYLEFGDMKFKKAVEHGLRFIRNKHRDEATGGYVWTLRDGIVEDSTYHCYGAAFVLLVYAKALTVGIAEAKIYMEEHWEMLEDRYWEDGPGLYRDDADCNWNFSNYRGQNSNMHMCEALLASYLACGEKKYLNRALLVARNMTQRQANLTATPFVWEHYDQLWNVDWQYNSDNPKHTFRPWGFQPGHQIQWAKLCLLLLQQVPSETYLLETAIKLYDNMTEIAWDSKHCGFYYGFSPNMYAICDDDKYFWVQAEAIATSSLLAKVTGNRKYWEWYDNIWQYVERNFVDHIHGAWFCILNRSNEKYSDIKSPAGKTDYHSMGACYEALSAIR